MDLGGTVEVPNWFIAALVLLIVAGWARAKALSNRKNFDKIFQPVSPSLKEGPSAWATLAGGVRGCLGWLIFSTVMILAFLLAIALLLARENTLDWLLSLLF